MLRMNCIITGPHIKVFGKVIHCLAKFGNELFLHDTKDGLALRSVNNSKSAYASVVLSKMFFHDFETSSMKGEDISPTSRFHCKINMKVILGIFKSLPALEKSVEKCQMISDDSGSKLTIRFHCRCDIIKTHELNGMETEMLNTVYSKENCSNQISMPIKVLSDILQTFTNRQFEVTLNANQDFVVIENELEDQKSSKDNPLVHTRLKLLSDEFENYQIAEGETSITFCLKELKGIVQFSEVVELPVVMFFSMAGRPIVFTVSVADLMEADFVLATLSPSTASSPETRPKHALKRRQKIKTNEKPDCIIATTSTAMEPNINVVGHQSQFLWTDDETPMDEDRPALQKFSIFDTPRSPPRRSHDFTMLASDTDEENNDC